MAHKHTQRETEEFKLRSIAGMSPPVYLFVLAACLLVGALLWIGLAVAGRGYAYTLVSTPPFAALRIDGHGEGVAPYMLRLAPGAYAVEVSHPDYRPASEMLMVERRLGDRLRRTPRVVKFALRQPLESGGSGAQTTNGDARAENGDAQSANDAASGITRQYGRIHRWSLTGVDQLRYQKPPVISSVAESVLISDGRRAALRLLRLAAQDVATASLLADWTRGLTTAHSYPTPFMSRDLVAALRTATAVIHDHPRTALLIERILEDDGQSDGANDNATTIERLRSSQWRAELAADYARRAQSATDGEALTELSVTGIPMVAIPAGRAIVGGGVFDGGAPDSGDALTDMRIIDSDSRLYIAKYETTVGEFRRFVAQNPQWNADNRPQLIAYGLVDDGYLRDGNFIIEDGADDALPIASVSWHAAAAYCRWLQTQLPAALTDYEVRLPTEREWIYIVALAGAEAQPALFINSDAERERSAFYNRAADSTPMPKNLLGSVWEWNANIFHISGQYFQRYGDDELRIDIDARPVKGGSAITSRELIQSATAAALFADTTSEHVGFRPLLVRK